MKNKSVLLLWALVFGNVLLQAESVLRITFIEDLCYNTKQSVVDLRYDSSGILMSAPSMNAPDSFECEVLLTPPKGASVVLSIFRYDLYDEDQLIIEDSDRHRIALMGWGSFKDEKKSIISDGTLSIQYKTGNKTSVHRRPGFQFTFTKVMNFPCSSNEFKCDNGKCVLKGYICDGHNHCGDRSDQKKCDSIRNRLVPPKVDSNRPEQRSRDSPVIWITLIGVASAIVLIVIVATIVVLVRRAKQKKSNNGSTASSSGNTRNNVPLQTVSPTVPRQVSQNASSTVSSVPNPDIQAVTANNPAQGNSLYNRVRRSLRGTRSEPRVQNIPNERSAPVQVPSMYPSLDQIPTAPDIHGVDNADFKIEE